MKHKLIKSALYFIFGIVIPGIGNTLETTGGFQGVWAGIEVIGCDSDTTAKIRNLIPIHNGMSFTSLDQAQLRSWCDTVRKQMTNEEIKCRFIAYLDGKYYFNVDIIPIEFAQRQFRTIHSIKSLPKIPKSLEELYNELEKNLMRAIQSGNDPRENYAKGYIDYQDPTLHSIAVKLSDSVPQYNSILLNVIRYSNDHNQRAGAATLLSWAKNPNNLNKIIDWDLLNDPNEAVRNNLARSISFELNTIKDKALLNKAIPLFCKQVAFPSHADRNKGLVSLKSILENNTAWS